MLVFWTLATVMTVVALAIALVPLLRARGGVAGPSEHAAALEVLRGQRREIESDIASGILAADARGEALSELIERAGEDLPADSSKAPPAAEQKPWIAAAIVAMAIPALAFGLYGALGTPSALDVKSLAVAKADDKQILAMVESLARKVRDRPDDIQGWALLGRSMAALGRFQEAADAYTSTSRSSCPATPTSSRTGPTCSAWRRAAPSSAGRARSRNGRSMPIRNIPKRSPSWEPRSSMPGTSLPRSPTGNACATSCRKALPMPRRHARSSRRSAGAPPRQENRCPAGVSHR